MGIGGGGGGSKAGGVEGSGWLEDEQRLTGGVRRWKGQLEWARRRQRQLLGGGGVLDRALPHRREDGREEAALQLLHGERAGDGDRACVAADALIVALKVPNGAHEVDGVVGGDGVGVLDLGDEGRARHLASDREEEALHVEPATERREDVPRERPLARRAVDVDRVGVAARRVGHGHVERLAHRHAAVRHDALDHVVGEAEGDGDHVARREVVGARGVELGVDHLEDPRWLQGRAVDLARDRDVPGHRRACFGGDVHAAVVRVVHARHEEAREHVHAVLLDADPVATDELAVVAVVARDAEGVGHSQREDGTPEGFRVGQVEGRCDGRRRTLEEEHERCEQVRDDHRRGRRVDDELRAREAARRHGRDVEVDGVVADVEVRVAAVDLLGRVDARALYLEQRGPDWRRGHHGRGCRVGGRLSRPPGGQRGCIRTSCRLRLRRLWQRCDERWRRCVRRWRLVAERHDGRRCWEAHWRHGLGRCRGCDGLHCLRRDRGRTRDGGLGRLAQGLELEELCILRGCCSCCGCWPRGR